MKIAKEDTQTLLVTPYQDPDLDGSACAYAYAEFLNKTKQKAQAAIFGSPHEEAKFVFGFIKITLPKGNTRNIKKYKKSILVDASDTKGLTKGIDPKKVIEVIDHRKVHEAHTFPNAKIHIELVGAAATLIAEKFHNNKIGISKESATLLYSAIVSNTINFQANVTTKRDKKMAKWLKGQLALPKNYTQRMFTHKSTFHEPLKNIIPKYFATFAFGKEKIGIAQLEIIGVKKFIQKYKKEILETLAGLKIKKKMTLTFLTCIDVEKGSNIFVTEDKKMQKILGAIFHVSFHGNQAERKGIIMRKEIVPKLKKFLENI